MTNTSTPDNYDANADDRRAIAREDAVTWEAWKRLQEIAYAAATGSADWWNARALAPGANPPRDAFTGPAWAVQHFLTGEAKTWFGAMHQPRYTFKDWQALRREQRAVEREEMRAAAAAYPLETLAYLRDLMPQRGALIAEARAGGATWAEIADAAGMSRSRVSELAALADPARAALEAERDTPTPAEQALSDLAARRGVPVDVTPAPDAALDDAYATWGDETPF